MHPSEHSRAARLAGPIGLGATTIGGLLVLSCFGLNPGTQTMLGPVSLLFLLVFGGLIAAAYVFGAFGLGRPLAAWIAPHSPNRLWIQLGLGLGAMLWLSHLLGVAGLLSGAGMSPRIVGWGAVGVGCLLGLDQFVRGPLRPERWPILPASAILWGPGVAVLLAAASNPPGTVWGPGSTEHSAFDSLSYHLQLPKEWAAGPRLWPSGHNVYSFLPSMVESAYLHLGSMMVGGLGGTGNEPVQRMIGGDGNWVIACEYLHALLTIAGAMLTGRAAWAAVMRCGVGREHARVLGVLAGAFVLATPWMLVVGSLPYNESGLLALGAAGMLIALDTELKPWTRGIGAGFAVGMACGCKPTALFLFGPVVGLLLLGLERPRAWLTPLIGGSIAGLVAILPWLARNMAASGNPVFPFASGLFGRGHWKAEQIVRHAQNHHAPADVGFGERLVRLFGGEFGLSHGQWGIALLACTVGGIAALAWKPSRRLGVLLTLGLLSQGACWMALTHMQSRFLLPMLVPGAILLALAGGAMLAWMGRAATTGPGRRSGLATAGLMVLALAPASQCVRSIGLFLEQNNWLPNQGLVFGIAVLTGASIDERLRGAEDADRARVVAELGPVAYINLQIRPQETPDAGVYLLGDSTPLYYFGATGRSTPEPGTSTVVYHTTWDTSMLAYPPPPSLPGAAVVHPWSASLRSRGIRYVLVNFNELERLIVTSRYYDPAVSREAINQWLAAPESRLRPVKSWPELHCELIEIAIPPQSGATNRAGGGS